VPGFFNRWKAAHDEGRTFQTILRSMDELGYDAEWQVFNSKNHGVPQNRERVFIIGHLRGSGTRPIFPITENERISGEEYPVVHCIDANYYKGPAQQPRTMIQCATGVNVPSRGAEARKDGVACAIRAGECGTKNIVCIPVLTPDRENKRQSGRRFKNDGDPSFAVTTQDRHGVLINSCLTQDSTFLPMELVASHTDISGCITNALNKDALLVNDSDIRKLTPTECERLQGFPDGWTTEGIDNDGNAVTTSDTQRYKCLGNAVTVNVIEFIAGHIISNMASPHLETP